MKIIDSLKNVKKCWNNKVKCQLRKVGIFKRLNLSFLLLLMISSIFLTFFSFYKYSDEINLRLNRYVSLLVQNVELKILDKVQSYEKMAVGFYEDRVVLKALEENAELGEPSSDGEKEQQEKNSFVVENKLYEIGKNRNYIKNIQFVSPSRQYHMVEANGYRRGGTIRNLEEFYKSDFFQLPQKKGGYPVWIDSPSQTETFYKDEQTVYGFANIVTLCTAVYEPDTRDFLGVLLFNIDINTFLEDMDGFQSYNDGNIFLIGKQGVLLGFHPSIKAPSFPADEQRFLQMLEHTKGIVRQKIKDRSVLLAYERIPGTEWFAAYAADLDYLLEDTYAIRNLCILVLVLIVIACFVISYYVTISISDPVRSLVKVMQKAGKGKWDVRYDNSGNDEITILGDRFNEMADKTNQLIEQVYLSEIKRQRTLLSWKNAQLDAMLMQINPHFLYNTLDIIRWEAMYEAGGESAVTQMIEKFSNLCRMGMRTGSNTVRLQEGIDHAAAYMDVINFRHSDKIQLHWNTEVDASRYYIPQFMLQPIMENAVVHAFGNASRGYWISIHSFTKEEKLYIRVEDNGKGMEEEELFRLRENLKKDEMAEKGIGLVNVNQRIRLFYGEDYGIKVKSKAGKGSTVEIVLPLRDYSENMKKDMEEGKADDLPGIDRR